MGFKENLLKKIEINQLAQKVRLSLKPSDPPKRIDKEAMQQLLGMADYPFQRERDLDLYRLPDEGEDKQLILVLDNELKLYDTTVADVALRKSPTVKEMVSIRNAIKILSDKDVVLSSKTDTLERIQQKLLDGLDLSCTQADIEGLAQDGKAALENSYAEGIVETLMLFSEMLELSKPPKPFQMRHHQMWAALAPSSSAGSVTAGPIVLYDKVHNRLKMMVKPISAGDKSAMHHLQEVANNQAKADLENDDVWAELEKMAVRKMVNA